MILKEKSPRKTATTQQHSSKAKDIGTKETGNILKVKKDVFHDDILIIDLDADRLKKYLQENFLVSTMGAPDKHRSQLLKKKYSG